MPGRVSQHPPLVATGLERGLGRAQFQQHGLGLVKIVDSEVGVELLRHDLAGPLRRAVQTHPLPGCSCGPGSRDWADLIAQMNGAIVNAKAGNTDTAAGYEGSVAADLIRLSQDAQRAGYNGKILQ